MTLDDNILVSYGEFEANSLCKSIRLGEYNDDRDTLKVIRHSPYTENDKLSGLLVLKKTLSLFSTLI